MKKKILSTLFVMVPLASAFAQGQEGFFEKVFSLQGMIFGAVGGLAGFFLGNYLTRKKKKEEDCSS
jgi:hypothetical protein